GAGAQDVRVQRSVDRGRPVMPISGLFFHLYKRANLSICAIMYKYIFLYINIRIRRFVQYCTNQEMSSKICTVFVGSPAARRISFGAGPPPRTLNSPGTQRLGFVSAMPTGLFMRVVSG